jgi:Protein of unknown function (DUF4019)
MARIAWRLVIALCLVSLAASAQAQDPRAVAVQSAARAWLALVDRDAQAAWNAGGDKFRKSMSPEVWTESLKKEQSDNGDAVSRTVGPVRFLKNIAGMPDGDYAQVLFRTTFKNNPNGRESLTLEREADGQWRVIGYFARTS